MFGCRPKTTRGEISSLVNLCDAEVRVTTEEPEEIRVSSEETEAGRK